MAIKGYVPIPRHSRRRDPMNYSQSTRSAVAISAVISYPSEPRNEIRDKYKDQRPPVSETNALTAIADAIQQETGGAAEGGKRIVIVGYGPGVSALAELRDSIQLKIGADDPELASGPLSGLIYAAGGLVAGIYDVALVVVVNSTQSPPAGTEEFAGILLTRREEGRRRLASLCAGLSIPSSQSAGELPIMVLQEACARAHLNPSDLSVLAVGAAEQSGAEITDQLRAVMSRGKQPLPHCALMCLPERSTFIGELRAVCHLATSIYERVISPAGLCASYHQAENPFYSVSKPRPWLDRGRRHAALLRISDEATTILLLNEPSPIFTIPPRRAHSQWPVELLLVQAAERTELVSRLKAIADRFRRESNTPLNELLPEYDKDKSLPCRLALLASTPMQMLERIECTISRLAVQGVPNEFNTPEGTSYSETHKLRGKTVLMFPGQGAQYLGMCGDLCVQIPSLQPWFERLDVTTAGYERFTFGSLVSPVDYKIHADHQQALERHVLAPQGGGAALFVASLGLYEALTRANVHADSMVGYSNGENAALIASGTWHIHNSEELFGIVAGACSRNPYDFRLEDRSLGCSIAVNNAARQMLAGVLKRYGGRIFLALDNCPSQVVLFGDSIAIQEASILLQMDGATCLPLPFSRGHHTPVFQSCQEQLRPFYSSMKCAHSQTTLYSCTTMSPFPSEPRNIRDLCLQQWVEPVRFRETIEQLHKDGHYYFVEVGPKAQLTGFVHNTLRGKRYSAISTNVKHRSGLEQLLRSFGQLFVAGQQINLEAVRAGGA